ncbi:protein INCA1 isoform X1 [Pelodiscus sinensis]|uniref:protein INCA1 isoform X1 n=1 Tax=Pelodiscus sinensis TaxID=13735 RepID=UPI003F6B69EE
MEETHTSLIPFAKQSRMVRRYNPRAGTMGLPTHHQGMCYHSDEFWSQLSQWPGPHWMKEYREATPPLMSSSAIHRPDAQIDAGSWEVLSIPPTLPSPQELCRRSGRLKRKKLESSSVMSVCYHLEELKKRQSCIDQLKRLKWGGYGSPTNAEGLKGTAESLAEEILSGRDLPSHETKPRPLWISEENSFANSSGSGLVSGLACPPPSRHHAAEQQCSPLEISTFPSVVAATDQHPLPVRCLPQEAFWGYGHQPEE